MWHLKKFLAFFMLKVSAIKKTRSQKGDGYYNTPPFHPPRISSFPSALTPEDFLISAIVDGRSENVRSSNYHNKILQFWLTFTCLLFHFPPSNWTRQSTTIVNLRRMLITVRTPKPKKAPSFFILCQLIFLNYQTLVRIQKPFYAHPLRTKWLYVLSFLSR